MFYTTPSWSGLSATAILAGIGGFVLFGILAVWVWVTPPTHYAPEDLIFVEGILKQSEEVHVRNGADGTLQIWIRDAQLPFRSNGAYPSYYDKRSLSELRPGVPVEVGSPLKQQDSPKTDYTQMQKFRDICVLRVGHGEAISLEKVNEWYVKNQQMGKIVAPVLGVCSVVSLLLGIFMRRVGPANPRQNVKQWYYSHDGRQSGPIAEDILIQMLLSGELKNTYVWTEGFEEWVLARDVFDLNEST